MKYNLGWLFILILSLSCHAQVSLTEKTAQRNLDDYNDLIQPEFIDLTIDKDLYFSGEKLWYSLRLSDGTLAVSSLSVLAYIEIRDGNDSVLIRQKIKCKLGKAFGDITIPDQLPTGYYKLTAFTIWMKNGGTNGRYQRLIPIINTDTPIDQVAKDVAKEIPHVLKIDRTSSHSFMVNVPPASTGALIGFNNEKILFKKDIDKETSIPIDFDNRNDHVVDLVLINSEGKIIDEQQLINENLITSVSLSLNHKTHQPRSIAELSIEVRDKDGNLVGGNFSVSVRPKASVRTVEPVITSSLNREFIMGNEKPLAFKRDLFIYPPSQNTLQPVTYSSSMSVKPYKFGFNSDVEKQQILASEMNKKVMSYYVVNSFFDPEEFYNLPFDNTFEPIKYSAMPSLEEFIREVVAPIKIRKVKGEKVLRVRNSDNPAKIYFFDGSPMILIDRFIVTTDEFLSVPLEDIERLDITWALNAINSLGVFSLADNGVVSITTKSKTKYSASSNELFKNLHTPLKFSLPKLNEKDKAVPLLLDPIYWNPSVNVNGRTKLMIELSDSLGELIVEVKGLTERGDYVSGQIQINVVPVDNK